LGKCGETTATATNRWNKTYHMGLSENRVPQNLLIIVFSIILKRVYFGACQISDTPISGAVISACSKGLVPVPRSCGSSDHLKLGDPLPTMKAFSRQSLKSPCDQQVQLLLTKVDMKLDMEPNTVKHGSV